jgi:hypothetical protein
VPPEMLRQWTVGRVESAERDEAPSQRQELTGEAEEASTLWEVRCADRDDASSEAEKQETEREIAGAELEEASSEVVKRSAIWKVSSAEPKEASAQEREQATSRQVAVAEREGACCMCRHSPIVDNVSDRPPGLGSSVRSRSRVGRVAFRSLLEWDDLPVRTGPSQSPR